MPEMTIPEREESLGIVNRTLVLCIVDSHFGAEWTVCGLRGEVLNR